MLYTSSIEIKRIVQLHRERYPLMEEEDVVKLVYQGQLGGGHHISSRAQALRLLQEEMEELNADENEPLIDILSREWFRLNLRPAKTKGIKEEDIAFMLFESTKKPVDSSMIRIYNRCMKVDHSEQMYEAAYRMLDEEDHPPYHSAQYWDAYHPAYRVLHRSFQKLIYYDEAQEKEWRERIIKDILERSNAGHKK